MLLSNATVGTLTDWAYCGGSCVCVPLLKVMEKIEIQQICITFSGQTSLIT